MFPDYKIGPKAKEYFIRGYMHQMRGELEAAVECYKKSLEIEETAEGHTFLGWAYSMMGRLEEAIEECYKAIDIDPEFGNPYNDIGAYLLEMGQPDAAIPWLEMAKQTRRYATPEYAYTNLGRAYEMKGMWPLALSQYEAALRINPEFEPARVARDALRRRLN
ncbi:MAG: tetratricopeptide repeat protein [Calditrichaeota bacterium]|nr:MAG: tetratricopeptide repeat protein [Calditrichota bacterium]